MPSPLSKEQKAEIVGSLQRYVAEHLDHDLNEMEAGFLLEFFMREVAPFSYNQGVEDARKYFIRATEDLPGACFQEPLTQQQKGTGRGVGRKPGR